MSVAATHTLGFDVSDRYSHYCLIDSDGGILEEGRLKTDEAALTKRFEGSPCRVVMEVGVHSPWMSRLFASMGNEVIVANPRRVQLIAQSTRKNDRAELRH